MKMYQICLTDGDAFLYIILFVALMINANNNTNINNLIYSSV